MGHIHRRLAVLVSLVWLAAMMGTAEAGPGTQWRLMGREAVLRESPDDAATVVAPLNAEARLLELERRVDWLRVRIIGPEGREGWIRERDLLAMPTPAAPSAAAAPTPAPEIPLPQYRLEITGTAALEFRAECLLAQEVGGTLKQRFASFTGLAPKQADFEVEAVSCEVRKGDAFGRLTVRLYQDDRIVAARTTAAAFNYVRVRSDGPWGPARATRGGVGLLAVPEGRGGPRRATRPQRTIVPSFRP